MARSNGTVRNCFSSAMEMTPKDIERLEKLAEKYGTGDITGDYVSAVQDAIAEDSKLLKSIENAVAADTKATPNTIAKIVAALTKFMNVDVLGDKVRVVATFADLKPLLGDKDYAALVADTLNGGRPVAFAKGGKAYIIADRVQPGQERAVFLHEVGSHLGLDRLLTSAQHKKLAAKVREWAALDDGSIESRAAKAALERTTAAGTVAEDVDAEHIAYFIEEAMKMGMEPSAASAEAQSWFRTIWAAFKSAIRKLGMADANKLTSQDVLNMAYGAARLEINGTWHGAAAVFRKFDHQFMGSGEGAQAYGWGTYLAQRMGIARDYFERDVTRKTTDMQSYLEDPRAGLSLRKMAEELVKFDGAIKIANWMSAGESRFGISTGDVFSVFQSMKYGQNYHAMFIQDVAGLAKRIAEKRDIAQGWFGGNTKVTKEDVVKAVNDILTSKAPEGALYRVDHNVKEHEFLQWEKTVAEQSPLVRKVLDGLLDKMGYRGGEDYASLTSFLDDELDKRNLSRDELTVADLIGGNSSRYGAKGLIGKAIQDGLFPDAPDHGDVRRATSEYLDSMGVKGVRHIDASSRDKQNVLTFDRKTYTRDEIVEAQRKAHEAKDFDTAAMFSTFRHVIRTGETVALKSELENDVERYRRLFEASHRDVYARHDMPVDEAELNDRVANDLKDVYQAKQLAWLNNNADKIKVEKQDVTYNHIIFNDKNIQRVGTQIGAEKERIKFSKAEESTANNAETLYTKTTAHVNSMLKPAAKDAWATVMDKMKQFGPAFLSNGQLVEQYGAKIPMLRIYRALQEKMTQERMAQAMKFHNISVEWDKLDKLQPGLKQRVNNVMLRSTLAQVHPDEDFTPGVANTPNGHLTAADKAKYDEARSLYSALHPEGKAVYQKAKDALAVQWSDRQKAYHDLVGYVYGKRLDAAVDRNAPAEEIAKLQADGDAAAKEYDKQISKLKGPYFPLMRFGDFLLIGESSELKALKDQVAAATGADRRKLEDKLAEMKKDAKHYEVSAHETKGKLNAAERLMAAKFGKDNVRKDMQDQRLEGASMNSQTILSNIGNVVDATFDTATAASINDSLADIYLRSLPEMHALRQEAHRKGIEGANPDMLRAFASTGQQSAFYISRLRHAKDLTDTMFRMKTEVKGNLDLMQIHREMEKRAALDMQYQETPIQDMLSSISWVYHLGMSPSNMMINMTQPWLVSAPLMAGRHGLGASMKGLGAAYSTTQEVLRKARTGKDGKFDPWSGIDPETLPNENERRAIRELMNRGIVDEGVQHELNMFADDKSRWMSQFNRHIGWANQQIELANRLSTALAAFRAELTSDKNPGKTPEDKYEAALKYAYDTTLNSQFDYSSEGKARIMRQGGGVPLAKLVMQFRSFQQGMLYTLGSNLKKSFGDGPEAKEARGSLAYLTLASGLSAGALGLPFAGTFFVLANLFRDDDDPDGDAETAFRNALRNMTGDKALADVLSKGIPAAFGIDISKRIGLGDIASLFPMARFDGRNGADQGGQLLMAAAGPAAGLGARFYDGMVAATNGDFAKAVEKVTPKAIADVAKAARLGANGMTDSSGDPTGTELGGANIAARAFGFASTKESDYYEGTNAIKDVQSAVKTRESRIAAMYKESLRSGDMSKVRAKINEFNEDHPDSPITGKKEIDWRKTAKQSGKDRQEGSGVKLGTKTQASYNRLADFAN